MLELSPVPDFIPRKSTRRDPWTDDEARDALAAVHRSGLSLSAFARRHGLCESQLYWWRARLRSHRNVESGIRPFVDVRTQALPDCESSGIALVVADVTIGVARGFDPQTLAQVVAALRPC